jgi:glycosyltransferase involved in cell wall biosynthesis
VIEKKQTLVHILPYLMFGGFERICMNLITHWPAPQRHSIIYFSNRNAGMLPLFREMQDLEVHYLPYYRWFDPTFIIRLARILRIIKPHAMLCYPFGMMSILSGVAAHIAGVPVMAVRVGNTLPRKRSLHGKWRFFIKAAHLLGMEIYPITFAVRESLRSLGPLPSCTKVILNGIDVKEIAERARKARLAKPSSGKKVVGMVARLDPVIKDHHTLIEAFSLIGGATGSRELWLIGDGDDRSRLAHYAEDLGIIEQVIFWGDRQDVPELLGQMDIFVFSTTPEEGFGNALAEALAAGLPVIASEVPACKEVLDDGRAGILVPPGDAEAMAKALEYLLNSPERCSELRQKAWLRAGELSIESSADAYYQALFGDSACRGTGSVSLS